MLFLSIAFCLTSSRAFAQNKKEYDHQALKKIEKRAEEKYFKDKSLQTFRYEQDTIIDSGEVITGNIMVIKHDLKIRGKVVGDIIIINGNAYIKPEADVQGDITCIGGRIRQSAHSTVTGNQIETQAKNLFPRTEHRRWILGLSVADQPDKPFSDGYRTPYSTLPLAQTHKSLILKYNRVQGIFLGLSSPKKITGKYNYLNLHGFFGYGFKEKKWRYSLGIDRWFFNQRDYRFELGAKIYNLTDTKDGWLITPWENSLAAVFLHQDLQDYYQRQGYEFHLSQNWTIFFKGTLAYRSDQYNSLKNHTEWSLFNGKKKFRRNPAIDEGLMRSLYGELYLDTRNNLNRPHSGWYARLGIETSNSKLNSDFSFNQYDLEVRRYQKLSQFDRLDMRIKIATSQGFVPAQKLYQLGGVSTLRGYGFKELRTTSGRYGGDRLLLANFEYNVNPRVIFSDFLFFDDLHYIFFLDMGNVWMRSQVSGRDSWQSGYSQLQWKDMKSDIGIGLSGGSGSHFRLNIAKRLDTGRKPFVFTLRLTKPF